LFGLKLGFLGIKSMKQMVSQEINQGENNRDIKQTQPPGWEDIVEFYDIIIGL
jgi:hypothetical protein